MTPTRLRVMCIVCPVVSLAIAGGLVHYECTRLNNERRELSAGTAEIRRLEARMARLRGGSPAAARPAHAHDHHDD